jgi:hypothetical protein
LIRTRSENWPRFSHNPSLISRSADCMFPLLDNGILQPPAPAPASPAGSPRTPAPRRAVRKHELFSECGLQCRVEPSFEPNGGLQSAAHVPATRRARKVGVLRFGLIKAGQ